MDFQKLIAVVKSSGLAAVQNFKALPAPTKKKVYIGASIVFGLTFLHNISRPTVNQPSIGQISDSQISQYQLNQLTEARADTARFINEAMRLGSESVKSSRTDNSSRDIMTIQAQDGTFLGTTIRDEYNKNSICNRYGTFGSEYNQKSIFNVYGTYGGRYSDLGAYNDRANKPPLLIDSSGNVIRVVSKNTRHRSSIDPDNLRIKFCGEPL